MSKLRDELQRKQEEHSIEKPQGLYVMDRFSDFWHQQSVWSQQTFGLDSERGPKGPLLHLLKEVGEALSEVGIEVKFDWKPTLRKFISYEQVQAELIDCLFLVVDAARRSGMNYERFLSKLEEKLAINKTRNWPRSDGDNDLPVEHDRTLDDKSTEDLSCPGSLPKKVE